MVMGPKFVADSMLGKLARWLRMSGYDVAYSKDLEDEALMDIAAEGRVLLTSDRELYRQAVRRGLEAELIESSDFLERLGQVRERRNLTIRDSPAYSRCPVCNGELEATEKVEVRGSVPGGVFEANEEFWRCRECKKVYWRGSHWEKIKEVVKDLRDSTE